MGRVLSGPGAKVRTLPVALTVSLVLAGCSSSADEPPDSATEFSAPSTQTGPDESTSQSDRGGQSSPATRSEENPNTSTDGWWITRTVMNEESVTLIWEPVDDARTYDLFRLESKGTDAEVTPLKPEDRVYQGPLHTFTDTTVKPDTFYTYVLVRADDQAERRWTEALTTTDTTPPEKIIGLAATRRAGQVELTWDPSSDDVEFASYAVFIVTGGKREYVGGGADEQQTGFVDSKAPSGPVTYAVQAVDFHDNRSELVEIVV